MRGTRRDSEEERGREGAARQVSKQIQARSEQRGTQNVGQKEEERATQKQTWTKPDGERARVRGRESHLYFAYDAQARRVRVDN